MRGQQSIYADALVDAARKSLVKGSQEIAGTYVPRKAKAGRYEKLCRYWARVT